MRYIDHRLSFHADKCVAILTSIKKCDLVISMYTNKPQTRIHGFFTAALRKG